MRSTQRGVTGALAAAQMSKNTYASGFVCAGPAAFALLALREPRRSSPASTASGGGKARATSVRPYMPYLTYPTYLTYQTHPTYATYATYLACSDVVFLSSSVFGGFGGRGRFIVRLTPFQNGSTFRSIS